MNEDIVVTFIKWRSSNTSRPDISTPSPQHALSLAMGSPTAMTDRHHTGELVTITPKERAEYQS